MLSLMENITRALASDGIPEPRFLSFFECGTQDIVEDSTLEGQWELAWNNAGHNLIIVAPSYMLALDDDACLRAPALALRSAIAAEALAFSRNGNRWYCPTLHLAEHDGHKIKVTAQCHGKLVLDTEDPFESGANFGFSLDGVNAGLKITKVERDPKDVKAILITCNKPIEGRAPVLRYASGNTPRANSKYAANCGALRDEYEALMPHDSSKVDLKLLRRWALPARLKIT